MPTRLRALLIVVAALAATALPTVVAFATQPHVPSTVPHSTPREEIQPAANIVGEVARRTAERFVGRPLHVIPEQTVRPVTAQTLDPRAARPDV
ncbi:MULTISPECIES: hypothetical protein [unclassified Streptomyces]|uniref:hypothetical protein n=1 Tax=unclassified Streptomyces TaxID=2593676 RepID=UPI0033F63AF7